MGELHGANAATVRRILLHEARVHAFPQRDLRDLGDALFLHDPVDPDPFWNRLEAIHWPCDPAAFDRRLDEATIVFASLGRRPHIWPAPAFDAPADLVARLLANGFEDVGPGLVMIVADPERSARAAAERSPGVTVERHRLLRGPRATAAAADIVDVLLDAFGVEQEVGARVREEAIASLGHSRFSHHLVRVDGRPAAVARVATFDGLSYVSSVGTAAWARGRGLGGLVTAAATVDATAAGSEWVYLGVSAENIRAVRLYERLGFAVMGEAAADLLLLG